MASLSERPDRATGVVYACEGNLFVARATTRTVPHRFVGTCRGDISGFSPDSARRMRAYLRSSVAVYPILCTLTYPTGYPVDGRIAKEHLRRFIQEYRRWCERHDAVSELDVDFASTLHWSVFWFLEFQQRGAPHFHLFITHEVPKTWVANTWFRIVNSEDVRHLQAGTRIEWLREGRNGTVAYATKYAAKMNQKTVPENYEHCGRFWGVWGCRARVAASTFVSARARRDKTVAAREKDLLRDVGRMVSEGKAEVLHEEPGKVRVVSILSESARSMVRSKISLIQCSLLLRPEPHEKGVSVAEVIFDEQQAGVWGGIPYAEGL